MRDFLAVLPNTFIPQFVAIDIFWLLPLFTGLTEGIELPRLRRIVRQSLLTSLVVGLAFIAVGEFIFGVLGITVNDFKVAGGGLLLVLAILDITTYDYKSRLMASETVGVVPIGVPLIVGPAVLATMLVLIDHYGIIPTVVSFAINLLVVWAALANASRLMVLLGPGVVGALSKLMAILLASIAVMMIRLGLQGIMGQP